MSDPLKQSTPADHGGRQGQDASHRQIAITQADRQGLIAAASGAFPVRELDGQAFGSKSPWGTHTRPGRTKARAQGIRTLVRAAEIALEIRPALEVRHLVAALRSLDLALADVLVDPLTGGWLTTKAAVQHRGRELAEALAELALIVAEIELEGAAANP